MAGVESRELPMSPVLATNWAPVADAFARLGPALAGLGATFRTPRWYRVVEAPRVTPWVGRLPGRKGVRH